MRPKKRLTWMACGLVLLAAAAIFVLRPVPGMAAPVVPAGVADPGAEALRQEIAQAGELLQARQATYQEQIQELTRRTRDGQVQLDALAQQEAALQQQLAELTSARKSRLDTYAGQLDATQEAYRSRFDQLNAQLQEAQARLAEANAILGR